MGRQVSQTVSGMPIPQIATRSTSCSTGEQERGRRCVTVIIVNWNSGTLLAKCMEFIRKQTMQPDHIVIVDNASMDDSVATLETYDRLPYVCRMLTWVLPQAITSHWLSATRSSSHCSIL